MQTWIKVLDKGMITIPKKWREDLGLEKGKIVKASKQGRSVVIEGSEPEAPFRVYTDKEISTFLKEDSL